MDEKTADVIRRMPRADLERLIVRAAVQLRDSRRENEEGQTFIAVLTGFLIGVIVAASGFFLGARLG